MPSHPTFTSLYRHLLHLSRRIPDPQRRKQAVANVQERFREHWGIQDEDKQIGFREEALSRIGFLKMMTPTSQHRLETSEGQARAKSTRLILRDGKWVEVPTGGLKPDRASHTNWDGKNLDPDSVSRHRYLLSRAGFQDNAHAKGIF